MSWKGEVIEGITREGKDDEEGYGREDWGMRETSKGERKGREVRIQRTIIVPDRLWCCYRVHGGFFWRCKEGWSAQGGGGWEIM